MVSIPPEVYADILENNIADRDGIQSVKIIKSEPEIVFEIEIDQTAYTTIGHFYYREEYEEHEAFDLIDGEGDIVQLIYIGEPITQADQCMGCEEIYHPEIDSKTMEKIDVSNDSFIWSLPV